MFPRTLTPKGTGLPDFQSGIQSVAGSLRVYGSTNIASAIGRIGTVGRAGTVRYIQAGSLGRVAQVGTIGRVTSVGSIRNIIAAQDIMTAVDIQARLLAGTLMRDRKHLGGAGSVWVGSWQGIANYHRKTYVFQTIGTPGSFAAIVGLVGTGLTGATGTIHSRRIGPGSYGTYSFEGIFSFTRPLFRRGGAGASGGTVTVGLARQP